MNVIKPLRDQLVVERFEAEKVTEGGILLPGQALASDTAQGRVLVVGDGAYHDKTGDIIEIDLKAGDVVLYNVNAGIKLTEKNETPERVMLREEDVLAIIVNP